MARGRTSVDSKLITGQPRGGGWTRREFGQRLGWTVGAGGLAWQGLTSAAVGEEAKPAARRLEMSLDPDGFGDVVPDNLLAVCRSAAEAIFAHCGTTEFRHGFRIFHHADSPITLHDHAADDRIQIGLCMEGAHWAQCAYQFAHEFCHALAGHANDWNRLTRRLPHANLWLEETLAETASLFALRGMAKTWEKNPPYDNWKDYAKHLEGYAAEHVRRPGHQLPEGLEFGEWFRQELPTLRTNATQREKNTIVAVRLLPLFEMHPTGWDSVSRFNALEFDDRQHLADRLAAWREAAGPQQEAFLLRLSGLLT